MNETLKQFIERKQVELEAQYRKVELSSYPPVQLSRSETGSSSVGESFLSGYTDLNQLGRAVTAKEFPIFDRTSPGLIENGTDVKFYVTAKGKRKPELVNFYFLWAKQNEGDSVEEAAAD